MTDHDRFTRLESKCRHLRLAVVLLAVFVVATLVVESWLVTPWRAGDPKPTT